VIFIQFVPASAPVTPDTECCPIAEIIPTSGFVTASPTAIAGSRGQQARTQHPVRTYLQRILKKRRRHRNRPLYLALQGLCFLR
jgi:hypothetical protein